MQLNDYIAIFIGLFAPLLVSIIRGRTWSDLSIVLLVLATAVGLSLGSLWLTDSFTSDNIKESIALMLATMFPIYKLLWEKTGLNDELKSWNPLSKFFRTKPVKKRKYTKRKPGRAEGGSVNPEPTTEKPNVEVPAQVKE